MLRYESFFDFEPYIQKAVEQTETILIKPETKLANEFEELF